jgi:hypothetical protein
MEGTRKAPELDFDQFDVVPGQWVKRRIKDERTLEHRLAFHSREGSIISHRPVQADDDSVRREGQ